MESFISENIREQIERPSRDRKLEKYVAPALGKGLEILELLAWSTQSFTLNQIASKLDRSVSEVYRVVLTLRERGYLAYSEQHKEYSLGKKALILCSPTPSFDSLIEIAVSEMRELSNISGHPCHFSVFTENNITVVASVSSMGDFDLSIKQGYTRSVLHSFAGPAIFSAVDEITQKYILETMLEEDKEKMDGFFEKVDFVNESGFTVENLLTPSIKCISVPMPLRNNQLTALSSIFVPYKDSKMSLHQTISATLKTASLLCEKIKRQVL